MKNLVILFCLIFMVATVDIAQAQLSKQEQKEWKKRAKELKKNPEQLKQLYDENASLKSEISGYQRQISSLESKISEKDNEISQLRQEVSQMEAEVSAARQKLEAAQNQPPPEKPTWDDSGVVFKVQIGAFRNKDLSKYFDNSENFSGETTDDGVQKITLGRFRDYWEADTFKKYLREMGVSDAWIVPYRDGERVAMKDVLEGVIQ